MEDSKYEGQRNGVAVLNRILFWLLVVFAVGETPLGTGELFGSAENRAGRLAKELRSGDLPARYSTPAESPAHAELSGPNRVTLKALAVEAGERAAGILPSTPTIAAKDLPAGAVLVRAGIGPAPSIGFSSRAPPAAA